MLFLGNPTYALTVVIFLMLLSSGAGSLLSRRWFRQPTRVAWAMAVIVIALLVCVFALPRLVGDAGRAAVRGEAVDQRGAADPAWPCDGNAVSQRIARAVAQHRSMKRHCEARRGGVGVGDERGSSVLGSVLAMVIAIQFGLNVTLACGAAAYVLAMLLLPTFGKRHRCSDRFCLTRKRYSRIPKHLHADNMSCYNHSLG